jgi:hypothetical protein
MAIGSFLCGALFVWWFGIRATPRDQGYRKLESISSNEIKRENVTLEQILEKALLNTEIDVVYGNDQIKTKVVKKCEIGGAPLLYQLEGIGEIFHCEFVIIDSKTVYFR